MVHNSLHNISEGGRDSAKQATPEAVNSLARSALALFHPDGSLFGEIKTADVHTDDWDCLPVPSPDDYHNEFQQHFRFIIDPNTIVRGIFHSPTTDRHGNRRANAIELRRTEHTSEPFRPQASFVKGQGPVQAQHFTRDTILLSRRRGNKYTAEQTHLEFARHYNGQKEILLPASWSRARRTAARLLEFDRKPRSTHPTENSLEKFQAAINMLLRSKFSATTATDS